MREEKRIEWKKIPLVTVALVFANILFFIGAEWNGSSSDAEHMIRMGAMYEPAVIGQWEYYRVITCCFLHFGLMHLTNNMISLLVLGYSLEHAIGSVWFGVIYFVAGIFSSLVSLGYHMYMGMNFISCGASGAIYGLFGALLVLLIVNNRHDLRKSLPNFAIYMILILFSGRHSEVDNAAHIGGFAAGIVMCTAMCIIKRVMTERNG